MSNNTSHQIPPEFSIKEDYLAKELEITREHLDEIVDFFDSDPNDEWDLKEGVDFVYINKSKKERRFSRLGAYSIAKYLDAKESKNFFQKLKEFFTQHQRKLRQSFISQRIHDNHSSLVKMGDRYFLTRKDVVSILCTSYPKVDSTFKVIQVSELPLERGVDYRDETIGEGNKEKTIRYYSLSAYDRICRALSDAQSSAKLTKQNRREWCSDAADVGKNTFRLIIRELESFEKKVQAAIAKAKKRDSDTCQVSGTKSKYSNLAAHHLYCKSTYPHIASSVDNLITITEAIHKEFHLWNGGFDKVCTVDDFIKFLIQNYPEAHEALLMVNQMKKKLGQQQPKNF